MCVVTSVCIHVEILHPNSKQWILNLSAGAWVSICCSHCQDALVSGNVLRKRGTIHRLTQHTHADIQAQSEKKDLRKNICPTHQKTHYTTGHCIHYPCWQNEHSRVKCPFLTLPPLLSATVCRDELLDLTISLSTDQHNGKMTVVCPRTVQHNPPCCDPENCFIKFGDDSLCHLSSKNAKHSLVPAVQFSFECKSKTICKTLNSVFISNVPTFLELELNCTRATGTPTSTTTTTKLIIHKTRELCANNTIIVHCLTLSIYLMLLRCNGRLTTL